MDPCFQCIAPLDRSRTGHYNIRVSIRPACMSESDRHPDSGKPEPPPRPDTADSGVDRTLIRWMMTLSPTERLEFVQRHVNAVQQLRESRHSE